MSRIVFVHFGTHAQLATLADPALTPCRIRPVHIHALDITTLVDVVAVSDRLRPGPAHTTIAGTDGLPGSMFDAECSW